MIGTIVITGEGGGCVPTPTPPSPTPSATPIVTPSVTVSGTPSETPTPTPSETVSVSPTVTPTPTATPAPPDNMVLKVNGSIASYPGSGSVWNDLSTYDNDGTLSNVSYDASNGGTFVFNSTSDIISFPDNSYTEPSTTESRTYMMWVKSTFAGFGSLKSVIMSKQNSTYNGNGFTIYQSSIPNIILNVTDSSGTTTISSPTSVLNTYQLITAVIKISADTSSTKLYVNTTLSGQTQTGADTYSENNTLKIGGTYYSSQLYQSLTGNIGEVRVYNKELSLSEITTIFNATKSTYGL